MDKFKSKNKLVAVVGVSLFVLVFGLGAYARPGIDLTSELLVAVFAPPKVVTLSEYEQKVNELWHSDKHQATCKANAAAFVSLELANKYLQETKKQQVIAEYQLPESLVQAVNKTEAERKASK